MSPRTAQWRLLLGAFAISFSAVYVELVSVSPTVSGFWRVLIGGAALALWLLLRRQRVNWARAGWLALATAALFYAGDLWFWHRSINAIGPGLATLLANLQVIFVTLLGALFLSQRPTPRQLLAIPLALAGLALIVGPDWLSLPADYRLGVFFGIATALCYAVYILTLRQLQTESPRRLPVAELAVISLGSAALLGVSAAAEGVSLALPTASDAFWLTCYGLLAHVLGWLLIASAMPHVTP
ncbi:MAG: DMT family transporter, partial [Pseudomonadota bacterium]